MANQSIATDSAPSAIGTYSQAVKTGSLVFLSGQIPLDPATMEIVEGGFKTRAEQVFRNLEAVAAAAGGSLADAVKITVYLTDIDSFPVLNEVMQAFLQAPYPARATVGVASLPKGTDVEADAILSL